jgi:serine/threonine-protein kinase RsbW
VSDSVYVDGAPQCAYTGPADGDTAADFRAHLRRWLDNTVQLDADRGTDIVLAAYEALANCAEHAYRRHVFTEDGLMTLKMRHDPAEETVHICVTDHGSWIEPDLAALNARRGRGLILMHGLADECSLQGRSDGTAVCLRFHGCPTLDRN